MSPEDKASLKQKLQHTYKTFIADRYCVKDAVVIMAELIAEETEKQILYTKKT